MHSLVTYVVRIYPVESQPNRSAARNTRIEWKLRERWSAYTRVKRSEKKNKLIVWTLQDIWMQDSMSLSMLLQQHDCTEHTQKRHNKFDALRTRKKKSNLTNNAHVASASDKTQEIRNQINSRTFFHFWSLDDAIKYAIFVDFENPINDNLERHSRDRSSAFDSIA